MTEQEQRQLLLRRLNKLAERLPNGLLHRLVEDADFFIRICLSKRGARKSARVKQHEVRVAKADERYWRELKKRYG